MTKLAEITDILVNQYDEDNEPLTKAELREILDAICSVIEKDGCDSCYHLLKEIPGKGCDIPSEHYAKAAQS